MNMNKSNLNSSTGNLFLVATRANPLLNTVLNPRMSGIELNRLNLIRRTMSGKEGPLQTIHLLFIKVKSKIT